MTNPFTFDSFKEALNPAKFIDTAEKNSIAVLTYVEPKELSKTLMSFTTQASDFARAQVAAFNAIATITKTQSEDLVKQFTKAAK